MFFFFFPLLLYRLFNGMNYKLFKAVFDYNGYPVCSFDY